MRSFVSRIGTTSLVSLSLAFAGCSNGSGPALVRLFFGVNSPGVCESALVEVSLSAADAMLATAPGGAPRCEIDAALATSGCEGEFTLNGNVLVAGITGCDVPAVANLFDCFFEKVDLSATAAMAQALCTCGESDCDEEPPICVSDVSGPGSCENCQNGVDDNGDGDTDCNDRNCEWGDGCHSLTTSTSSSTTYTTNGTIPPTETCIVIWRMTTAVEVAGLSWITRHLPETGYFAGGCESLVPGATASWSHFDSGRSLKTQISSPAGFTGPVDVSRCNYRYGYGLPDLRILETVATDPDGQPIDPAPEIITTSGECVPDDN